MSGSPAIVFAAVCLAIALPCPFAAGSEAPPPLQGRDLEAAVEDAIDGGVEFLLSAVTGPEGWSQQVPHAVGYAGLELAALLACGVSCRHPALEAGWSVIEGAKLETVYGASMIAIACDGIIEEAEAAARRGEPLPGKREKAIARLEAAARWLLEARLRGVGAWDYRLPSPRANPRTHRWDHSNTQFAVLALGAAVRRGIRIPAEVWEEVADHLVAAQEPDGEETPERPVSRVGPAEGAGRRAPAKGRTVVPPPAGTKVLPRTPRARGFRYEKDGRKPPTLSMTCAGVSSLLLAARFLPASPGDRSDGSGGRRAPAVQRAIDDGYARLVRDLGGAPALHFDPYAFYSLEKVGDLGALESFGGFRWWEECVRAILSARHGDGGFGPARAPARRAGEALEKPARPAAGEPHGTSKRRADVSLCLLVLARATDLKARSALAPRTGGAARAAGAGAGWLLVPSLGGEVSRARLFRLLRYRGGKEAMRLVEEAVEAAGLHRSADVALPLLAARERSPFPEIRAFAGKRLAALLGMADPGSDACAAWASRLGETVRIGDAAEGAAVPRLRDWLRQGTGARLRTALIWALERTQAREALPDLIDLLLDPDPSVREAAHRTVTFLSGASLPFHPRGSERTREAEARAWRDWLSSHGTKG